MTPEDIIRMARNSGMAYEEDGDRYIANIDDLQDFAQLVAAAEREKMTRDGWRQCSEGQRTTQFCSLLEEAVLQERKALAALFPQPHMEYFGQEIQDAIRARGQQ